MISLRQLINALRRRAMLLTAFLERFSLEIIARAPGQQRRDTVGTSNAGMHDAPRRCRMIFIILRRGVDCSHAAAHRR